ncbi:MAG: 3-phosphoshikimate 1-carboxyvinyltransferase [Syntrophomonadaceae bacterium]|nr:3-phosphoshikimate 1-carboxyvinyltransferase [Syntrophomonadaceae bacterium]MDD4562061.1 3-phosphoshikimate 1-carboxyvinyltransferase [Syntrophomonadaceae bacterium]
MDSKIILKAKPLKGEITVAADKSISHRAVIFSALARGESIIKNLLAAEDIQSTCRCMKNLGVDIQERNSTLVIKGGGLQGLKEPNRVLDCGNSGTTMRLLTGVLSAQPFFSVLTGDHSLNQRPMRRVIEPLQLMGAELQGRQGGNYPPLAIKGGKLKGINYSSPVASAQVKTAILLAALNANGVTEIWEPEKSRDHSENMLAAMGASIQVDGLGIQIQSGQELSALEFLVPGDISAAAFFLVAATIVPGSELKICDIGVNPTRTGIIEVLQQMGANIKLENQRTIGGEKMADIIVTASQLKGVKIEGEIIPRLIDELPVLAVAMAVAEGESEVREAGELRIKETDRIAAICGELGKMGVAIAELEDGFRIKGKEQQLQGVRVDSHGDHRIAMSLAVAGLIAEGETIIGNAEAVNISFPSFWNTLEKISR